MKSVERHRLETNWLAKHLETSIGDARPYFPTIVGVIVAVVIIFVAWSWLRGSSASNERTAWDAYNVIVGNTSLNQDSIKQLNRAAEMFQGTSMEEIARITYADGQVWTASGQLLFDRKAATDALNSATSVYQSLITSSSDKEIVDRANFGLGRIYELRDEPEKARDAYGKVTGRFAVMAKFRLEELAKERTQETLNWLATAQAVNVTAPAGGGSPGQRPLFGVEDFALPDATSPDGAPATTGTGATVPGATSIEELFKGLNQLSPATDEKGDRYQPIEPQAEANDSAETTGAAAGADVAPESPAPSTQTQELPTTSDEAQPAGAVSDQPEAGK